MNQIYYVGYDGTHPGDFCYNIPSGFPCYLLVITTTPALFSINGVREQFPAHTAILYPPGCDIWYGACDGTFGNHWLRFATDESFVVNFPQQGVPFSVSDPEYCRNLFQLLTWETSLLMGSSRDYQSTGLITRPSGSDFSDENNQKSYLTLSQLLRILFDKLHDDISSKAGTCHNHALLSLHRQIAANPQLSWNVADMAKMLHMSSGYLQLLYKQQFGTPCMEDVIYYRLSKACDLLTYTSLSVAEIADQCGYNNPEYFCRQFHRHRNMTPGQFRKQSRSQIDGGDTTCN